jgi:hypothetical protein
MTWIKCTCSELLENHRDAIAAGSRMTPGVKNKWQGWCQTNSNQSLQGQHGCPLRRAKLTPFSESGGSVELESGARVKVAFLVEMIVDRGVDGDEFLQTSHSAEPKHCPFFSSKW